MSAEKTSTGKLIETGVSEAKLEKVSDTLVDQVDTYSRVKKEYLDEGETYCELMKISDTNKNTSAEHLYEETKLAVNSSKAAANAADATEAIEYEKVLKAYYIIKETATRLNEISKKINAAGDYCTPQDFSVQGYSYSDNIDECCNCFQYASKGLDEFADSLLSEVKKVVSDAEIEAAEKKRKNNNNNDNDSKKDTGKKDDGKKDTGKKDTGKKDDGKKDTGKKDTGKKDGGNDGGKSGKRIDINNLPDEETLKKMIENGEIDKDTMKKLEEMGKLPAPPKK